MSHKKSRRKFLEIGLKTGIALPFASTLLFGCNSKEANDKAGIEEASKKLQILILGGTSFLGPHQIAYALKRGHSVTTFTRGKTIPTIYKEEFTQVEQLIGDRNDNLKALENRTWDIVIDNSGRNAEWTKRSAALLKNNCALYVYTSSTGVFYPYINSEFKEDSEVVRVVPENAEGDEKLEYDYGVMKANSETEAVNQFGVERTLVIRPTYMIGPADKSNRFIHWPIRLEKGGEILVPGKKNDPVQYIDVRDVAEWTIRLIEEKIVGTFNVVGPKEGQNMYSFLEEAKKGFEVNSTFVKIDDYEFLKEFNVHHIVPWIMPIGKNVGSANITNSKAIIHGLSFRSIKETVIDTFKWWHSEAVSQTMRDVYESDENSVLSREKVILKKWKTRKSS